MTRFPARMTRMIVLLGLLTSACNAAANTPPAAPAPSTLTVMTHDSFAISEAALAEFQTAHNVSVQFLTSGDAGSLVNKAILARQNPLADVIFGFDNTFLSRALEGDILEAYAAPALSAIPAEFQLDPSQRALPIDYGDVCVNYDLAYLKEHDLAAPQVLEDLLKPEYRGLLVVQNPATSSPGLAFLLATVGHFGESGYLDYWRGLAANDVLVVNDWESAYNTEFTRGGGTRPLVVSYSSSPAFEVLYAAEPVTSPQTGVMTGAGSCFRQIEFAGILKGTAQRALAEQFIDFLLGPTFQAEIPLQMFVFPVVPNTPLDETFARYLAVPEAPAQVDPARIASQREVWIAAWTEVVLR